MRSILMGFKLWNSLILCGVIFSCSKIPVNAKHLHGFALGTSYNIQYVAISLMIRYKMELIQFFV